MSESTGLASRTYHGVEIPVPGTYVLDAETTARPAKLKSTRACVVAAERNGARTATMRSSVGDHWVVVSPIE